MYGTFKDYQGIVFNMFREKMNCCPTFPFFRYRQRLAVTST